MPQVTTLVLTLSLVVATVSLPTADGLREDKSQAYGTNQASTRLMKELVEIYKSDSYKNGVIQVELEEDNLYEWNVKMFFKDPHCSMFRDLQQLKSAGGKDHVMIRISFGDNYPNAPPFVRFVYPYINLVRSGAFCMHLLSPQGWFSACPTETLILAVMEVMNSFEYNVDFYRDSRGEQESQYSAGEAREEFERLMKRHGWDKATGGR